MINIIIQDLNETLVIPLCEMHLVMKKGILKCCYNSILYNKQILML